MPEKLSSTQSIKKPEGAVPSPGGLFERKSAETTSIFPPINGPQVNMYTDLHTVRPSDKSTPRASLVKGFGNGG